MRHTNGEWIVNRHTTMNLPYKYTVSNYQETDEEAEANAKLIAAAPDLLGACGKAFNYLDIRNLGDTADTLEKILRQAINKAKGK